MKRSEMISMILDSIGTNYEFRSYELHADIVSEILKICEKAGMLPPEYKIVTKNGAVYNFNEWEEE